MADNNEDTAEKGEVVTIERVNPRNLPPDNNSRSAAPNEKVTRTVLLFSAFIAISATICNFDLSYGGTVLLMQPFNTAFGPCSEVPGPSGTRTKVCQLTALQQSLVSLTTLFNSLGAVLSSVTGAYFGRRVTIQSGALLVLVGAAGMLGTNSSYLNYMVCKCISGVGLGLLYAGTIVYGVECTTPQKRGMLLGLFCAGLGLGNAIAAGVCAVSSGIPSNWAWKTPIACQIPLSVALGAGVALFPESPRWLLMTNKEEQARRAVGRFIHQDPNSDAVGVYVREVQTYLDFEKVVSSTASWTEMFHKKHIRRTLLSVFILVIAAMTGIFFIAPYAAIFLGGLGISSPFLITAIINICVFAGSLLSGPVIEYGGRRLSLLLGLSIMAACMLIFSAVSSGLGTHSPTTQNVLVAFLCIWCFTFGGSVSPCAWVASTEMHSIRLRTSGQALSVCINCIFGFAASFWTPYMINPGYGNLGTNVGYFYFGITVVCLIITVLFVPETARLKLEQIDDYFESGIPAWKTSIGRNKRIAESNILEVSVDLPHGDAKQSKQVDR